MKKYILRVLVLLILASVTLSGCSVEYRENHRGHGDRDHDHDDHHDHDYHYYHN